MHVHNATMEEFLAIGYMGRQWQQALHKREFKQIVSLVPGISQDELDPPELSCIHICNFIFMSFCLYNVRAYN